MNKNAFTKIICTVLICLASVYAKAQVGFDYAQYDFGVAAGLNSVYGDAQTVTQKPSVHLSLNFNQTPFVNYILEAQFGQMAGGNQVTTSTGRQFASNFQAFEFRAQVQAGEIIDYSRSGIANAFKNLYVGTGIGIIYDNITSINRYSLKYAGYYTPGDNSASETFLPIRVGYEFKVYNRYNQPSFKIDIAYQYNMVFGDELDGFKTGANNDAFSQFSIGFKFALGGVTSYRKQIYY